MQFCASISNHITRKISLLAFQLFRTNKAVAISKRGYFLFQLHTHEVVEVCAKILYQVELSRNTLEQMWGFSVEAELVENADRQDELCCYVSRVEDKSVAMQNGNALSYDCYKTF